MAWGDNSRGQTNVPAGLDNVLAIAGGGYHSLALKNDGTVVGWGDNSSGQTIAPEGLGFGVGIAAGLDHSVALSTTPPVVSCPPDSVVECGQPVTLTARVAEPDGDELTAVWWVNGAAVRTNTVPEGNAPTQTNLSLWIELPLGTNVITVAVADAYGVTVSCSTKVRVVDTTAPSIVSAVAIPNVLWPPNHQMVRVSVRAVVRDAGSATTWRIADVTCNQPAERRGSSRTEVDWQILDDHHVLLRAERTGGKDRSYNLVLRATDGLKSRELPN